MKSARILFWSRYDSDLDTTHDAWREREIELSPLHLLSLASHQLHKGRVILYTYQKFATGIPNRITVKDANDVFPSRDAYKALRRGHSIAHISDAVRLSEATARNGIMLDMDAVIINALPEADGWLGSHPAKATGGFAPKWGKSHPPIPIHDKSWDGKALTAFPVKVSASMENEVKKLVNKIEHTLSRPPAQDSKAWNYVMWTMKKVIYSAKDSHVFPPIGFCPIPAWMPAGKCYSLESPTRLTGKVSLFGYRLPSITELLSESYVIQHFFESTFKKCQPLGNTFWANKVPTGSLLACEAEKIIGNDWREKLSNTNKVPSM